MNLSRKFLRVSTAERQLLIKAALLLEAIKLGLRLLPFRMLRRLLARMAVVAPARLRHEGRTSPASRIAWAVEAASRRTLGTKTCLTQALAAQVLLARHGHPTLLHIGVAKGAQEGFQAHAWIESEGKILIGGAGCERYTSLIALEIVDSREEPWDPGTLAGLW